MKMTSTIIAAALGLALWMGGCSSQQQDSVSVLHHFNTGNEAYRIEDYRRAIIHFRRALDMNEDSPDIQYNLGLAYYRSGNYEDAVGAFNAALRARPAMLDAHYNLALAHDRLFNADAAHSHYNAYRKLMIAKLKNDGSTGRARVIPEVGAASRGTASGGTMVNGGAISTRGRAATANGAGFKTGGGTPAALTADGASAARRSARARRGRPVPGYAQSGQGTAKAAGGTAQAGRGTAQAARDTVQQGLRQPGLARQSTARRAVRSARAAPVAPRQNSQQQSGDKQKWWIQDRLNRTR